MKKLKCRPHNSQYLLPGPMLSKQNVTPPSYLAFLTKASSLPPHPWIDQTKSHHPCKLSTAQGHAISQLLIMARYLCGLPKLFHSLLNIYDIPYNYTALLPVACCSASNTTEASLSIQGTRESTFVWMWVLFHRMLGDIMQAANDHNWQLLHMMPPSFTRLTANTHDAPVLYSRCNI